MSKPANDDAQRLALLDAEIERLQQRQRDLTPMLVGASPGLDALLRQSNADLIRELRKRR